MGHPTLEASEPILTIRPRPLAHSNGEAAWEHKKAPFKFTSSTRSHSSSVISVNGANRMTPAAFTSVSNPPKCPRQAMIALRIDAGDVTSRSRKSTFEPRRARCASWSRRESTSPTATCAAFANRACAIAKPKPLAPPVTNARRGRSESEPDMRTFLPSTPTRSSPCAHHQRTTRRPAHAHRRLADSAKEVFLDDVLSDIDPQTGDVSHREIAVHLRPRVEHQLLLHWRFMRLEVHTMTLGRNGKQMHTRRCIQRTAPGVEAKVEVFRLNELDHIVATRNAKTPAWIHLHHVDAP